MFVIVEFLADPDTGYALDTPDDKTLAPKRYGLFESKEAAEEKLKSIGAKPGSFAWCKEEGDRPGDCTGWVIGEYDEDKEEKDTRRRFDIDKAIQYQPIADLKS